MSEKQEYRDMPDASYEETHVHVGKQLAARISCTFYPSVCDLWMVEDAILAASERLANHVKTALNEREGKHD